MPYISNSWSLKDFINELKKEINSAHVCIKSVITSQARVVYQRPPWSRTFTSVFQYNDLALSVVIWL